MYPSSGWLQRLVRPLSSKLLFARAPEQDDTKKERHDEWNSRDSDNETGTGVPWRRERSRVRIVETSNHEEQQRDPSHDHECTSCPQPEPLHSTEGSCKRPGREIGQSRFCRNSLRKAQCGHKLATQWARSRVQITAGGLLSRPSFL